MTEASSLSRNPQWINLPYNGIGLGFSRSGKKISYKLDVLTPRWSVLWRFYIITWISGICNKFFCMDVFTSHSMTMLWVVLCLSIL